jgi:hypothetical protein
MAHVVFTSLEKLVHLLNTAPIGQGACVRVLGPNLLGLGVDPLHPTHTVDLVRETVSPRFNEESPIDLEPSSIQETEAPVAQKRSESSEGNNRSAGQGKKSLLHKLETA